MKHSVLGIRSKQLFHADQLQTFKKTDAEERLIEKLRVISEALSKMRVIKNAHAPHGRSILGPYVKDTKPR